MNFAALRFRETLGRSVGRGNWKKGGAPARIRTLDQLIKSQLLYQLSYRGNQPMFKRFR